MKIACFLLLIVAASPLTAEEIVTLPRTQPLTMQGDLSAQMVEGIDRFLMREIEQSIADRQKLWARDFSSREAYNKSIEPNRERFRRIIGAVDESARRNLGGLDGAAFEIPFEYVGATPTGSKIAETKTYTVYTVRWLAFGNVHGEGLLLQPKRNIAARVIAIPDADQTPEMIVGLTQGVAPEAQFARRLAENGCEVLVPVLIDRRETWSGNPAIGRKTNQPHREWIYRQAFEMGRHIIGYEVQKVLAAVDYYTVTSSPARPILGLVGYGEGGLIALYAAALDTNIEITLVSGYFDSRQRIWEEPIYRNVFGLLHEFGDAEIASLIAPRALIIEHSAVPTIEKPAITQWGANTAAPCKWRTPKFESVEEEFKRVQSLFPPSGKVQPHFEMIAGKDDATVGPCSDAALGAFLKALNDIQLKKSPKLVRKVVGTIDQDERQKRQIAELVEHTQKLMRDSEAERMKFWSKAKVASADKWQAECQSYREYLAEEVIGRFPFPSLPLNARTRKIYDEPKWTGYEVVLDVWPDVFAWGVLLVPKDLKEGEKRPVVVCQHGLEGVPAQTITTNPKGDGYAAYKGYAARLADRGFIVYAPHNPYRGMDKFRVLQRKANPLGKSLFSIIVGQHERSTEWLASLPFVDPQRIAFYGLSYGGKTAMRVPPLVDRYCLSICSADFNDWIKKCVTVDSPYSYMFTIEYEMPEWNLGNTFNYAELAGLIAPRPFMVERGHDDGVAPNEWVAYEYAKVRRLYVKLGIGDRTEIEFFNGPHTINGVGTFEFLHKHLNWPKQDR